MPDDTPDSLEWLARVGLVTRGLLYVVVALLALRVAFGDFDEEADRDGALQAIARQPLGRALLLGVLVGLLGYATWRAVLALRCREWTARMANAGRTLLYLGAAYATLRLLTGSGAEGSDERDWTARAFDLPAGRWLVGGVGVAIIGAGLWNGYRAVSGGWRKRLETGEMEGLTERWAAVVAAGGLFGRMGLFSLVGGFLVRAAVRHDPGRGVGLDAALKELASKGYGPYVLTLFAAGLALFGLFSFVEARYRRVTST